MVYLSRFVGRSAPISLRRWPSVAPIVPSGIPAARLGLIDLPAYLLLWTSGRSRGAPRSRDLLPEVHPLRESWTPLQFSISASADAAGRGSRAPDGRPPRTDCRSTTSPRPSSP